MRKNQLTCCLLLFVTILSAQSDLKIGEWKSYLPYYEGRSITQSETTVYFASKWSLFTVDKEEGTEQFFSKVEGLSDVGMSVIKYSDKHETLIATYENSNIDLLKPEGIINLPFIKEDPNIIGDKAIYNIHLEGEDLAYLACGFGVVELNIDREEFGFTTKMNLKVNDVIVYNGSFYAATDEGIYRAPNNGTTNLQDFGNWAFLGETEGFPTEYTTRSLAFYENNLYLDVNDTLYSYDDSGLNYVYSEEGYEILYLTAENEHLLAGMDCGGNCFGKVLFFDGNHNFKASGELCVNKPYYAIEDESGGVWYSDKWDKVRISETTEGTCVRETYNTPYTQEAQQIVVDGDDLYITTLKPGSDNRNGFYQLKEGEWTNYNSLTRTALAEMYSAFRLAVHPVNKKVYVATFWNGMWEKDGESFVRYDTLNSPLTTGEDPGKVRVGGLAFDEGNNLWMTNHSAPKPLVVFRADGGWQNNFTLPFNRLQDVTIDQAGNKWCRIDGGSQGLLVFNEFDINDPNDDVYKIITTANTQLPSNSVNCIKMDLDGDIWVGTDKGIVIFECGSNVFDDQCQGSKRIVEVDGFNAFLLETETVQTIAVDGANRKWIGTTSGLFVQSPNGEDQITFFDQGNSPLFNNNITAIEVNNLTGEVFIGTTSGMLSVRGEALGGGFVHEASVYAYPNPVRPEYDGPIAIKGLPRDADVKITDVKGQLVYQGQALGGQAIWDGRDYNGRKAASGVYLVFSTSKEVLNTPNAQVTKILFMK